MSTIARNALVFSSLALAVMTGLLGAGCGDDSDSQYNSPIPVVNFNPTPTTGDGGFDAGPIRTEKDSSTADVVTPPGATFTVGGNVTGLVGSIVLTNNGGDDVTLAADGAFTFKTKVAGGGAFVVAVKSAPATQTCVVKNGSGTISANVGNVAVTCTTNTKPTFTVGGTITGLTGTLVLQDNGGDDLSRNASGGFTFATKVESGKPYVVTVLSAPATQTCLVANGSSTVGNANVTSVTVSCTTKASFTIGGSITGLTGSVVIQDNGGDDQTISTDGNFTFATKVVTGQPYAVTVKTQPPTQTCTPTNDTGNVGSANVTNVTITCL